MSKILYIIQCVFCAILPVLIIFGLLIGVACLVVACEEDITVTPIGIIPMEITKLDVTETYSRAFGNQTRYRMSVANHEKDIYLILDISSEEYAKYGNSVGDSVNVEVESITNARGTYYEGELKGGN